MVPCHTWSSENKKIRSTQKGFIFCFYLIPMYEKQVSFMNTFLQIHTMIPPSSFLWVLTACFYIDCIIWGSLLEGFKIDRHFMKMFKAKGIFNSCNQCGRYFLYLFCQPFLCSCWACWQCWGRRSALTGQGTSPQSGWTDIYGHCYTHVGALGC